jgi:hypothetical protein
MTLHSLQISLAVCPPSDQDLSWYAYATAASPGLASRRSTATFHVLSNLALLFLFLLLVRCCLPASPRFLHLAALSEIRLTTYLGHVQRQSIRRLYSVNPDLRG